jgi:hypothetical protein
MNTNERKQKNSLVHVLMQKAGVRQHKEALLSPYDVESVTELEDGQIEELIERLQRLPELKKTDTPKSTRQLRSTVILAAENYLNTKISDPDSWHRFNKLLLDKRIGGKMMWEMTEDELKQMNKKIRLLTRPKMADRSQENYLAKCN